MKIAMLSKILFFTLSIALLGCKPTLEKTSGGINAEILTFDLHSPNPGASWGSNPTPTFLVTNITFLGGTIQLFSDSHCTAQASEPVSVTSSTATITANTLNPGTHQFYLRHHSAENQTSDCFGPVAYTVEILSLGIDPSNILFDSDSTPTFNVTGLTVYDGVVQLFNDPTCTTVASNAVVVTSRTASITANSLAPGSHRFYVQHKDTDNSKGNCFGFLTYTMENLTLTLATPSTPLDPTPTFNVNGLVIHDGTLKLFRDSNCQETASGTVNVSSDTASITASSLTTKNHQFYVQHTDSSNDKGRCFGPLAYTLEILDMRPSSNSLSFDPTPSFDVTGFVVRQGTIQLFSDSSCTISASGEITVSSATASIAANALDSSTWNYRFYVRHKDSISQGLCFGPVAYKKEEPALALDSSNISLDSDFTPTFNVTGLLVLNGTIQLFSDSTCTTAASGTVAVSAGTASITANTLLAGSHNFYVQHTDSGNSKGDCVGPIAYTLETLTLALSSPDSSPAFDPTPDFNVTGIVAQNGTIRLFKDSTCTTAGSSAVTVSSGSASVTADELSTTSHQFYVQHTDTNNNTGRCFGPVPYDLEILTLALSSENVPVDLDSTPSFDIAGLLVLDGTIQLFSDSNCSTSASDAVTVSTATASITANALAIGTYQFSVQHTDSNGNVGSCFGSIAYEYKEGIKAISAGEQHTCAIIQDDSLYCWGSNRHGQLGNGSASSQYTSVTVDLGIGRTAKSVSAGYGDTCAILDDNSLKCWGSSTRTPSAPSSIDLGTDRMAIAVSLGTSSRETDFRYTLEDTFEHICAILDDDSLKCWGYNAHAQLGDGSTTNRSTPTAINFLGTNNGIMEIDAGTDYTCAILNSGSLKCWGDNGRGRLGDGTTTDRHTPTAVNLGTERTAIAVSAGYSHTCAVLENGSLKCWGENSSGQLGHGTRSYSRYVFRYFVSPGSSPTPTSVNLGANRTATAVSTGHSHTCAILDNGNLKCWGDNDHGQLGDQTITDRIPPTLVDLGMGRTAKIISLGSYHTCAILDDDSLKCWGRNHGGHTPTTVNFGSE